MSPDRWHLEIQRPVYVAPRAQWSYDWAALPPLPTPAPASGWHPAIAQPQFDARRQQFVYPELALGPYPIPAQVSGWQPQSNQPQFDQKRLQYSYPSEFRGDVPRIETLYLRSWQPIEQPLFDVRRQQYLYPPAIDDTGQLTKKEAVSLDRWHPAIERVLYDPRRAARISNEISYADIPRNLIVGADRWTPSAEMPRRLTPRADPGIVQVFVSIPPPVATWVDAQVAAVPVLPRFRPFDTPSGLGDRPRREATSVDRWLADTSPPLFPRGRNREKRADKPTAGFR